MIQMKLSPRVDLVGVACCQTFKLDLEDSSTKLPVRNSNCFFSLEAVPPFFCIHLGYATIPLLLEPTEGEMLSTTELPVDVRIHKHLRCLNCPSFFQLLVKQNTEKQISLGLLKIVIRPDEH